MAMLTKYPHLPHFGRENLRGRNILLDSTNKPLSVHQKSSNRAGKRQYPGHHRMQYFQHKYIPNSRQTGRRVYYVILSSLYLASAHEL